MVIGLFQRHYKIYRGLSFIPLNYEDPKTFTMIIGNNGVGKSSIFEALDSFFNNRPFNINLEAKKSEAFVAPLFLVEKLEVESSQINLSYCEIISDFLWQVDIDTNRNYKHFSDFFSYRDKHLNKFRDSHYLLTFSKENENTYNHYFTFTNQIYHNLKHLNTTKDHNAFLSSLKSLYKYIYIPVETSIEEFLKIETKGMQSLVDKKISDEIDIMLNDKRISRNSKRGKRRLSLMDIINEKLKDYIDTTERTIKTLYEGYDFKMQHRQRQNLTSNDIKEQIIYSYLSKRSLKRDNKPIKDLSAGERKKALIDIAYSFISGASKRISNIILTIDEPESSLHISNCYEQFQRIQEISHANRCQVFISTHWYGSLPLIDDGSLIHISLDKYNFPTHKRFSSK